MLLFGQLIRKTRRVKYRNVWRRKAHTRDILPSSVTKIFMPNPNKKRLVIPKPIVGRTEQQVTGPRKNKLGIQMLSRKLYQQIFLENRPERIDPELLERCIKTLKDHGMQSNEDQFLPDVDLRIPPLKGNNIEEHFYKIASAQAQPYLNLVNELVKETPTMPKTWLMEPGWTCYKPGEEPKSVPFPDERALVFDIEVCVNAGKAPTLATAVSNSAWYGWVSPTLIAGTHKPVTSHQYNEEALIPLESTSEDSPLKMTPFMKKPKIIVGHNVSYDRARIKEQYWLNSTGTRFLDTMSLHVCVSGVTSYQRAVIKSKNFDEEDESWKDNSSLNSLVEVYKLYCKKTLEKTTRDLFVDGTMSEIKADFQNVMNYCARDVRATQRVLKELFPMFQERFPHPATFAGMLEIGSAYLPINNNWNRYISDSEQAYEDSEIEGRILLAKRADQACQLQHDNMYEGDLWMWDQDWSVKNIRVKKKTSQKSQKIKSEEPSKTAENCEEDEDVDPLEEKFRDLWATREQMSSVKTLLPGYPKWYSKLCSKPNSDDWVPGPNLISTSMKITPKLLSLTWEGYPLHFIREKGWGFLIPFTDDLDVPDKLPLKQLLEKCPLLTDKSGVAGGLDSFSVNKEVENNLMRKEFYSRIKKDGTGGLYKGTGVWCNTDIDNCCWFMKLPHKNGPSYNVGNPLAKDFLNKFSEHVLAGDTESAEKILTIARMLSYWRNNRDRIMDQMVVWLDQNNLPKKMRGDAYGAILPQVISN